MSKINPPFRADHVGSLLRPEALLEARQRCHNKEISKDELREIEDRHIEEVIKQLKKINVNLELEENENKLKIRDFNGKFVSYKDEIILQHYISDFYLNDIITEKKKIQVKLTMIL